MGSEVDCFVILDSRCWSNGIDPITGERVKPREATCPTTLCHPHVRLVSGTKPVWGAGPGPPHPKRYSVPLCLLGGSCVARAWMGQTPWEALPHHQSTRLVTHSTHSFIHLTFSEDRRLRWEFCLNHKTQSHEECLPGQPKHMFLFSWALRTAGNWGTSDVEGTPQGISSLGREILCNPSSQMGAGSISDSPSGGSK